MLRLRVTPRAATNAIVGWRADGALGVRVTAPPVEGAANEALCAFLAHRLALPRSRVRLLRGATSRAKVVCLQGVRAAEVAARLGLPAPA